VEIQARFPVAKVMVAMGDLALPQTVEAVMGRSHAKGEAYRLAGEFDRR
jgi:hypothetical protein